MTFVENDLLFMRRALELARRALGRTRPNPHVGAVIVRDGAIIGEGWHERAGGPHAELAALRACAGDPAGATMYVTLEPCNHHGRTPPCTEAVICAGIARVLIGQRDPNATARGGVERLRAAGIDVVTGVLEEEARLLNPAFNTFHGLGRPLVTLKWAMSLDGCTSCEGGHSGWITNEASRRRAHEMRAAHDATAIGIGTALTDNARLSARGVVLPPGPERLRIVLDSRLRLPQDHAFVRETQDKAIIVCAEDAPGENQRRLEDAGCFVWRLERNGDGVSIPGFLARLHAEGAQSVLIEGGRRVAGSALCSGCVDRVAGFTAPVLIGAGAHSLSPLAVAEPIRSMDFARRLHQVTCEVIKGDVLIEGWLSRHLFSGTET